MKIAITGGTGFIGRHLIARHVALGDEVYYLTRKAVQKDNDAIPVHGDLGNIQQLRAFVQNADVLYHCAAEIRDESRMDQTNVQGTANLLAAAWGSVGRWLQLSSTGVYGPQRQGLVTEAYPYSPINAYEHSKTQADLLVYEAVQKQGLNAVIIRPSTVYGTDMPNQSVFQLIKMIQNGWFFYIGKPGATANYIHVNNVVDAMILAATVKQVPSGSAYIVSDYCTMEQWGGFIAAALACPSPKLRLPEALARRMVSLLAFTKRMPLTASRIDALTGTAIYASNKIVDELDFRLNISIKQGITELVKHWLDRQNSAI